MACRLLMLSDSLIQPFKKVKNEYEQPSRIASINSHKLASLLILLPQISEKNDRSMIFQLHLELFHENVDSIRHSSKNHFLWENAASTEVFDEFMESCLQLFLHDRSEKNTSLFRKKMQKKHPWFLIYL